MEGKGLSAIFMLVEPAWRSIETYHTNTHATEHPCRVRVSSEIGLTREQNQGLDYFHLCIQVVAADSSVRFIHDYEKQLILAHCTSQEDGV